MGEAVIPTDILYKIKTLEERIQVLESTSRLQTSSLRDGTLTLQDQTGTNLVYLGKQPDGTHGIAVLDQNGRILFKVTAESGQVAPFAFAVPIANGGVIASTANAFRPGTHFATFTELWRSDFFSVGDQVDYDIETFPNSGNMDWEIVCYEYGGGVPVVVASGNDTATTQHQGTFTIPVAGLSPLATSTDVAGRFMTIRVLAKQNSGALSVDVSINGPFTNHS